MANEGRGRKRMPGAAPVNFVGPVILGLVLGSAAFGGYLYWSGAKARQAQEAAPGDPSLAKPTADECAIVRAVLSDAHASGKDAKWRATYKAGAMSLRPRSQVVNPTGKSGYTDEEVENLRGKGATDWRGCPDMGTFIHSLGWSPMTDEEDVADLALGRPAVNKTGDEAKLFEGFIVPDVDVGSLQMKGGPWLVTLHRGPNGAWAVAPDNAAPAPH
jgi:hypothetical protein